MFSKDPSTVRKNGISALERLPIEILQQIFLLCDVFHLPLASPTLSAGLSSEHVYWSCLVHAFNLQIWRDDESVPTMNFLLSRRWMTRALFERLVTRWEQTICPPFDPAYVALDLSNYNRIAHGARIPLNLLRPPFTNEKDKFLACVIGQGARIDWVRTTDGEVALNSLEIAIRQARLPTIRNLLTRPAVGIRTDLHFVKVAVFDGGCQPDVVDLILCSIRKPDPSIDWLDPDLQRWGRQKEVLRDPQGSWLLFRLKMCSNLYVGEYSPRR